MKVYVVECGVYNDRYISGVYATPEAAMAAHPVRRRAKPRTGSATIERDGGWREDGEGRWDNGLDWDDAVYFYEYELEGH